MRLDQVPKDRLRRMAARWHAASHSGRTLVLKPGQPVPDDLMLPEDVARLMAESETGAVLFWSQAQAHLVLPPFPVEHSADLDGWIAGPLQSLLDRPRRVAALLLRLGGYAVGVFEGERLVASKVASPFVKGRHKKGGSSSGRFARRREGQARVLFDKACETLREQVEPWKDRLDHFILGGDRLTITAFEKRCPYLGGLGRYRLRRRLDVPDPRLRVLQGLPRQLYTSRVATFQPPMPAEAA